MLTGWIRRPQGEVTVVFVHGVLSKGETCWESGGVTWPEILRDDPALSTVGIYVFDYRTRIFSGNYHLGDAVDHLKETIQLDGVDESRRLIFVCHSMGGILVRKFLVDQALELYESRKDIGLFLVASPSLGSRYADWLSSLARLVGNAQAETLRFVTNNQWLADLDKNFINLKEDGRIEIHGKELVEERPIAGTRLFGRPIVEPFSGARYFGNSYKVPGSDHFSISKPEGPDATQHRQLRRFITTTPRLRRPSRAPSRSASPIDTRNPEAPRCIISMTSIYAVDEQALGALVRDGADWNHVTIGWPASCETLLSVVTEAVTRFDTEASDIEGAAHFIGEAPEAIAAAIRTRSSVSARLPDFVRRLQSFDRNCLQSAVKSYLLLGNLEAHRYLAFLASWKGITHLGLQVPGAAAQFQTASIEEAYGRLLRETAAIHRGRIERIGDHDLSRLVSSPVYLYAPGYYLRKYGTRIADDMLIATWLTPQLELELDPALLPESYHGGWTFGVVKNAEGDEI